MKFASTIVILGMAASMAVAGFASPTTHKSTVKKTVALICPVTGEKIDSIKDAAGHSKYKGKTYYFCCSSCKPMFDKNPAKYAK